MSSLLRQHLPLAAVAAVVLFCCGQVWWVSNQSRDIVDARTLATEALAEAKAARAAIAAEQLNQAAILAKLAGVDAKLAGVEAQLVELRAILLRRGPQ